MWGRRHTRFSVTISSECGIPLALEFPSVDISADLSLISNSGMVTGLHVYFLCERCQLCTRSPPNWLIKLNL